MKQIIMAFIVAITMISCSSNPKVEYMSGQIEEVTNRFGIGNKGDTVIVEHYVSIINHYISSRDGIWGKYKGVLPEEKTTNTTNYISRTWYEKAVKQ